MKLSQVKGSTWVAEAMELIPFYKLDDRRVILLDSGLKDEREELEASLLEQGLSPAGILCSHAHVDHCGNNRYFQEKYHIPVALTLPEAGMCSSILNLKCYFLMLPPAMVERESSCMVHTPDIMLPADDGPFSFVGTPFRIIHTPGHSSGHISTITPDHVCYTADALISQEYLGSKLPYNLCHALANTSREKLRNLDCAAYIMAHRGVCSREDIDSLIDDNQTLVRLRTREILDLISQPMTASQIVQSVCQLFQLFTHKPPRSLRFERNIRFFIEYLVDEGLLEMTCRQGVTLYRRSASDPTL
ncbi:MAG: MBL fold metallo-hydrolase [Lawsonibacter sp.]|nr:MBL fold metallo-hydrolase [Lawsonibacter sp.]